MVLLSVEVYRLHLVTQVTQLSVREQAMAAEGNIARAMTIGKILYPFSHGCNGVP